MTIEVRHLYRIWVSALLTVLLTCAVFVVPPFIADMGFAFGAPYIAGAAFASFLYTIWFARRAVRAKRRGDA